MSKYINILYEIFLTKFVYSKTMSFYIKKYFFKKIRLIRSSNRNNGIKFGFKISILTLFGSVFDFLKYVKKNSVISVWYPNSEKKPNAHP